MEYAQRGVGGWGGGGKCENKKGKITLQHGRYQVVRGAETFQGRIPLPLPPLKETLYVINHNTCVGVIHSFRVCYRYHRLNIVIRINDNYLWQPFSSTFDSYREKVEQ